MQRPENDKNTVLTDDEVVALGVDRKKPWLTRLPTVDVADADDVSAAWFRGGRSLRVRGLLERHRDAGVSQATDAVDLAIACLNAQVVLSVAPFDASSGEGAHLIGSFGIYRGDTAGAEAVLDYVSPIGTHQFRTGQFEDLVRGFSKLFLTAYETGVRDAVGTTLSQVGLIVAITSRTSVRGALISRSSVKTGTFTGDAVSSEAFVEDGEVRQVDGVVDSLIEWFDIDV